MTKDERFEILKIELSLIQTRFDKYDDMIFRGRNAFITLWLAAIGLSFTIKSLTVTLARGFLVDPLLVLGGNGGTPILVQVC